MVTKTYLPYYLCDRSDGSDSSDSSDQNTIFTKKLFSPQIIFTKNYFPPKKTFFSQKKTFFTKKLFSQTKNVLTPKKNFPTTYGQKLGFFRT